MKRNDPKDDWGNTSGIHPEWGFKRGFPYDGSEGAESEEEVLSEKK